ncbi:MAG TPA: ABC transporter substrate-binding protein [Methanocella sp.]
MIILIVSLFLGCTGSSGTSNPTPTPAAGSATPTPPPAVTLRLGYLANSGHALTFVAQEEGFFAKQGLNIQLSSFPNSASGHDALIAGKLDVIAMGSTAPVVYITKGNDLRYIGGLMGEGTAAVTLPQNVEKYTNFGNWKGKNIATVRMSTGDVVYRSALKAAGINATTETNIQELLTPQAVMDAVTSGKADIGIVWLPYQQLAPQQGLSIINYGDQFYPGHPCCRYVVSNTTLQLGRDSLVRFEKAIIEADAFVANNKDKTITDVSKYAKFNNSVIYDSIYMGHFTYSPDPNKKGIEQWWKNMQDIGYINTTLNVDDFIDTSVYKQALDELIREYPDEPVYKELLAEYNKNDL